MLCIMAQPLSPCLGEAAVVGWFDWASHDMGADFLCTFVPPPPPPSPSSTKLVPFETAGIQLYNMWKVDQNQRQFLSYLRGMQTKKLQDPVTTWWEEQRVMTSKEIKCAVSACQGSQTHCALCHERLKGQWKHELQQFLQQYSAITPESCVCGADNFVIWRTK